GDDDLRFGLRAGDAVQRGADGRTGGGKTLESFSAGEVGGDGHAPNLLFSGVACRIPEGDGVREGFSVVMSEPRVQLVHLGGDAGRRTIGRRAEVEFGA